MRIEYLKQDYGSFIKIWSAAKGTFYDGPIRIVGAISKKTGDRLWMDIKILKRRRAD